jgi:uncharacterized protein YidB (DUF937 family)
MDLTQIASQLLSDKLGLNIDQAAVTSALSSLLGDGSGNIDFAGLASRMASSGELGTILNSWLGDGANESISADSIMGLLGQDKVADFAGRIGTSTGEAASGLADVLPQVMDKASSGGNLLEQAGGISGLMGAARSFLS